MLLSAEESVADPGRDPASEERMAPHWRFWAGNRDDLFADPQTLDTAVRERGYAWPLPWKLSWYRSFAEEYFAWNYAQLFTFRADHFASGAFGRLHTLSLAHVGPDGAVLVFCPARRGLPSIEGRLRLAADTTLAEARWSYRTPGPAEDAGAEVAFRRRNPGGGARPLLLAERSAFWRRRMGAREYARYSYVFLHWEVGPAVRAWNELTPPAR